MSDAVGKRGGERAGAGRPASLSPMEKVVLGSAAKNLSRDHATANAKRRIDARVITDEIRDNWRLAQSIPVNERKAWLESYEGQTSAEDIEFSLLEVTRIGKLQEDPWFASQETEEAPRLFSEEIKRPYGKRKQICRIVAMCATRRLNKPVSPRMVDRCWKRFNAEFKD